MKKWVSRVRIGVGIALVVLGVVLLVVGWVWPFYVNSSRTIVYGDRRTMEFRGVSESSHWSLLVLSWQCQISVSFYHSRDSEGLANTPEDQVKSATVFHKHIVNPRSSRDDYVPSLYFTSFDNWRVLWFYFHRLDSRMGPQSQSSHAYLGFPPWLLSLAGIVVGWSPMRAAWILRVRRRKGLCLSCGYELKGLATCPECGKAGGSAGA